MKTPDKVRVKQLLPAVVLPMAACAIQLAFREEFGNAIWFLFCPAVFFSSIAGGLAGGLAATLVSELMVLYFFLPPVYSFRVDQFTNYHSLVFFALIGTLFSLVHEKSRRALERINRLYNRAEDALRESEEKLRQITENIREVFWVVSPDAREFHYISPAFEAVWGRSCDEALRDPGVWISGLPDEDREKVLQTIAEYQGKDWSCIQFPDFRVRHSDGSERWIRMRAYPVRNGEGKIIRAVGIAEDITDHRKMEADLLRHVEKIQRDAQIRSELLDEVNHRVKNNLVSILGILRMEKQELSKKGGGNIKEMLDALESRIGGMVTVHELLTQSHWSPVVLGQLIQRILQASAAGTRSRGNFRYELKYCPDAAAGIRVEPRQATALALVLNELVTNSRKYAFADHHAGRISIQMKMEDGPDGFGMLLLTYKDDGTGWPADVLAGEREGVGLRLIRGTLRGLPKGSFNLSNDGGAVATCRFKIATAAKPEAAKPLHSQGAAENAEQPV
jgi:PAS domain S-box-containing protein